MRTAANTFEKLRDFSPEIAQYIVPNAYNRRVLARFNLREAYAFCQLRTAPNAHFSIRRIAWRVYEAIRQVHPRLTGYMHLPDETSQSVEEAYFAEC
jgi:thymidylate synthase ThyX